MNILRWIFFIPLALISAALGEGLIIFLVHLFTPNWKVVSSFVSATGFLFAGIMMPLIWMGVGMKIAPQKTNLTKWLLLIPLLIACGLAPYNSDNLHLDFNNKHLSS